jgi:hypothetical protein
MKKKEGEQSKTTRVDTSKNGARLAPAIDLRSKQLSFRHSLTLFAFQNSDTADTTLFCPSPCHPCVLQLARSIVTYGALLRQRFQVSSSLLLISPSLTYGQVTHQYFWVRPHPLNDTFTLLILYLCSIQTKDEKGCTGAEFCRG